MKKIILSVAVVTLGFAATSCKKSYTCECVDTSTSPDTKTFTTLKSSSETDAATTCYNMGNASNGKYCGIMAP